MCTTYYPKQACMSERELDIQSTHKKAGQSKFDQVYSAINQSYAKIYTSLNERFSPKKEDEKISEEGNSDTSSSFDDLMPHFDLKDLEIGAYYLQRETEDMKNHLSGKELRLLMKKERKWGRIMAQGAGRPHELTEEESIFYSEEDLCLKQYALSHPRTFPQLLHEGPPMQYRWSVWKLLLRPHRFYEKGLYERLKTLPTTSDVQIKKDLHRTFPEEKYFSSQKYNKIGQKQLENVLRAISLYFNNTGGYVQGMNFLAGLLLLISGGDELESFWMFVALARDPKFLFMGLFEKDFPLLNFYVSMFYQVLEVEAPILYHHMQKNQLPIDLWLFKWFLTIFVPTLPSKDVVRIWDLILRQGFLGIIKVAVGIVKFYDKELLHQDAYGMNLMFQSIMEDHLQKEYQENINILNTFNPIINIFRRNKDKNSTSSSKPANVRCSFRDFDVEEVLDVAYEIDLDYEHLKELISNYETKSGEKLQEPYRKIMSNLPSPHSTVRRFKEFQNEIDSYMMRIGLKDSEKIGSELSTAEE